MKAILGVAIAILLVFSVWSYGNGRAARALSEARKDSLDLALSDHAELELERDSILVRLNASQARQDTIRDSLALLVDRADRRSEANLGALAAALADTVTPIPDTIRVLVGETIAGLEDQTRLCRLEVASCDVKVSALESEAIILMRSRDEKDELLVASNDQLEAAIAAQGPPEGAFLLWIERGLAAFGLLKLIQGILGGG